jgi:hypothetical protein
MSVHCLQSSIITYINQFNYDQIILTWPCYRSQFKIKIWPICYRNLNYSFKLIHRIILTIFNEKFLMPSSVYQLSLSNLQQTNSSLTHWNKEIYSLTRGTMDILQYNRYVTLSTLARNLSALQQIRHPQYLSKKSLCTAADTSPSVH